MSLKRASRLSVEPICTKKNGTRKPKPKWCRFCGNSALCLKNVLRIVPAKNAPSTAFISSIIISNTKPKRSKKTKRKSCELLSSFGKNKKRTCGIHQKSTFAILNPKITNTKKSTRIRSLYPRLLPTPCLNAPSTITSAVILTSSPKMPILSAKSSQGCSLP